MTDQEFWTSWPAISLLASPFLLAIAGLAYSLYLSHHHLDTIKEALKNSRYIYLWGPSLGKRGLIWSLLEMAKITGMIMMPRVYIRLGELDPDDIQCFPPYLKRLLKIDFAMMVGSGVWLAIVSVLQELT